jgi:hypothetical protein
MLRPVKWQLVAAASALLLTYCGSSSQTPTTPTTPTTPPQPTYTISNFIAGVTAADGTQASQQSGAAPTPTGGPPVSPTANNNIISGGSNVARLQATAPFQTVYTYIGNAGGNVGGYYQLRLPVPTMDASITYSLGRDIPTPSFDTVFGLASPSGAIGPYSAVRQTKLNAATGEVQVSVSWNAASDIDLHVVDPRGEEIFWNNPTSASGGQLDLDSNAACAIDGKNNENIRWTTNAPSGSYTVRLDYWSGCGVGSTNFVVTVNNGGSTNLFTGNFTGQGDMGDRGSGRLITTFNRGSGVTVDDWLLNRPRALFSASPLKLQHSTK